jgi:hypothetical protein
MKKQNGSCREAMLVGLVALALAQAPTAGVRSAVESPSVQVAGQDTERPRGEDPEWPRGQDTERPRGEDVQQPRGEASERSHGHDRKAGAVP